MSENIVCYLLLKHISENFPKGSLIDPRDNSRSYVLHPIHPGIKDTSVCAVAPEDVAPISARDYQFLSRISDSKDRYEVFASPYKLKWAQTLKSGDRAYAKLRKKKQNDRDVYTAVVIKWVGQTRIGVKFGVEIIDSAYYGRGDSGVNKYFKCPDNCGMLLDLDYLECDKLFHPNIPFDTQGTDAWFQPTTGTKTNTKATTSNTDLQPSKAENAESDEVEKAEKDQRENEKDLLIAALQAQIRREMGLHQSEMKSMADKLKEQLKHAEETQNQLHIELFKKAENHASELQEVIDHHKEQAELNEQKQTKLIEELNRHFQNEIKAAHLQWQQVLEQSWKISPDEVGLTDIVIGSGRMGSVVRGSIRGSDVAVKKLKPELVSVKNVKLVCWKINLLAQIRHPNLLLFLGAYITDQEENSLIVTELLDSSLCSAYQKNQVGEVSRVPILRDIAAALAFLHTNQIPIVHGDLTSSRVLLEAAGTHKWRAKVSIFGLANIIQVSSDADLKSKYAAPELITGDPQNQTDKVDVYSFGVLVCEVVLCQSPPVEREEFPLMLSKVYPIEPKLFHLAMNCTKQSHEDRPSMLEVTKKLSNQ